MTIIMDSGNLTPAEKYTLTRGANVRRMSEAIGSVLNIAAWLLRDDSDGNGEPIRILSIKTVDGEYFSTNSAIMIREFDAIRECFEGAMPAIMVIQGKSKNNRNYITCSVSE